MLLHTRLLPHVIYARRLLPHARHFAEATQLDYNISFLSQVGLPGVQLHAVALCL
jgi:hypothetical protein